MRSFLQGFVGSLDSGVNILIYVAIFIVFSFSLFLHFKLRRKLIEVEKDIEQNNRIKVTHTDIKSVIEKYFSEIKLFKYKKTEITIINAIEFVKAMISVLIILGVLGTFLSMVNSLSGLQNVFSEETGMNSNEIGGILEAMSVAFYTSIMGMVSSLILTVITKAKNNETLLTQLMYKIENEILTEINNTTLETKKEKDTHIELLIKQGIDALVQSEINTNQASIKLNNIEHTMGSFSRFTNELDKTAVSMKSLNGSLDQSMSKYMDMFNNVDHLMTGFERGLSGLNSNFEHLFTYFKSVDNQSTITNDILSQLVKQSTANNEIFEEINKDINTNIIYGKNNAEKLNNLIDTFIDEIGKMQLEIHNMSQSTIEDMKETLLNSNKVNNYLVNKFTEENDELFSRFSELKKGIGDTVLEINNSLIDDVEVYSQNMNENIIGALKEVEIPFKEMTRELNRVSESMGSRLDSNISKAITEFSKTMSLQERLLDSKLRTIDDKVSIYTNHNYNLSGELIDISRKLVEELKQVQTAFRIPEVKSEAIERIS